MPDPLEDFAHRAGQAGERDRIDAATVEVVESLVVAGVDCLVLKGPVLTQWLYEPHEIRGYGDCDLLAAPDRFGTAERVLKQLRFHSHGDEASHPEAWEEGRSQVWHRLPEDVWVDLQWRLPGAGAPPSVAWEILWGAHETMLIAGARVPVPSEPARALHLALAMTAVPDSRKAQLDLERGVRDLSEDVWRAAAALAERLDAVQAFSEGLPTVPGGDELTARLGIAES